MPFTSRHFEDFDDMVGQLDPSGQWSTDGYGLDSCLIHCGSMIEQDCDACPDCGATNPLVLAGLI